MNLEILHTDNHLLAVRKPAGCPVVPDESGDPSLLDHARAWVERTYGKPGRAFLGVVHRLDRPVSGVVLFARTSKGARRLGEAFRSGAVEKRYWGVARRAPAEEEGELAQWLRKEGPRRTVRAHDREVPGAKLARTRWRVLEARGRGRGRRVLLELEPITGRPHQLRVAMASLGAPLLGDLRYGAHEPLDDRSVALHAHRLTVPHPTRGEALRLDAAAPRLAVWDFESCARP